MSSPAFSVSTGPLGEAMITPTASIPFTSGLTTPLQASVANPALGNATIFVNSAGDLSLTGATGNTVQFLDSPADFDQDMNGNNIIGIASENYQGDIQINAAGNGNIVIGDSTPVGGSASNAVQLSTYNAVANSANAIVIGASHIVSSQYAMAIGENITTAGFAAVNLGGGNSGWTNNQSYSVALGADMTFGAGSNAIALGKQAGVGAVNDAIAIGVQAVNGTASSCLIGDPAIANIRPNSAVCDLATSGTPFANVWAQNCRVLSRPVPASLFSSYADVTVASTTTETTLISGSALGSLTLSAPQPVGMAIALNIVLNITSAAGDSLTLRVYAGASLLLSQVLSVGASTSAEPDSLKFTGVVRSATMSALLGNYSTGQQTYATPAYNPAIPNTLNVTAQWGGAASSVTANQVFGELIYANGA